MAITISIITTVDHNVGDDFVREGLKYILQNHFKDDKLKFLHIHKHSPITSRFGFEKLRTLKYSKRIDKLIPKNWTKDRVLKADYLVQSGAPVYWCHHEPASHCYENEWFLPLIEERFSQNKNAKLLNLAAGTCQTYHSDGTEFCEHCNDYITSFYNDSSVTTLRDTLAQKVLGKINLEAPVIPCSSIFAIDQHNLKDEGEEYVVMNYMKGGAHFTFGQEIDFDKWENTFKSFYFSLKEKERVIIACHNKKEVKEALELDPDAEIFHEKDDYLAFMRFYGKAKFGIMNRVHGAFLMASYGKPSIIIGNDSRAKMAEEIGLQSFFVNDVSIDLLNEQYDYLISGANNFKERFKVIKEKALKDYLEALAPLKRDE